ncbi:MAG: hypothetical protein ACM3NQ_09255 [Bacteroidales bacterium]
MSFGRETDPLLRRFERNQVIVCAIVAAAVALFGRLDLAAGVVAGTLLMAIGYGGIKAAVNLLTAAAAGRADRTAAGTAPRRRLWMLLKFTSRYALLVLAAYVMLVRLHLHPLGVMLGASTPVICAAIESVTIARGLSRAGHTK